MSLDLASIQLEEEKNADSPTTARPLPDALPLDNKEKIASLINKMSSFQKFILREKGYIKLEKQLLGDDYRDKLPMYLFTCEKHGFQIGYQSGYNEILLCPDCLKEDFC